MIFSMIYPRVTFVAKTRSYHHDIVKGMKMTLPGFLLFLGMIFIVSSALIDMTIFGRSLRLSDYPRALLVILGTLSIAIGSIVYFVYESSPAPRSPLPPFAGNFGITLPGLLILIALFLFIALILDGFDIWFLSIGPLDNTARAILTIIMTVLVGVSIVIYVGYETKRIPVPPAGPPPSATPSATPTVICNSAEAFLTPTSSITLTATIIPVCTPVPTSIPTPVLPPQN